MRPFRFGVTLSPAPSSRVGFTEAVKQAAAEGFDVVTVMDHFRSGGIWATLLAAHHAAPSLRVGTLVLNTDLWHPALLAREAVTADELTGGRLELGLGAGWDMEDYRTVGRTRRPAGIRIERLAETLEIVEQAFSGKAVQFHGRHFTVEAPEPWARPRQERPSLLVGGGGRRILELAGQKAAIASISRNLQDGGAASWREAEQAGSAGDLTSRRIAWVRDAAGARFPEVELHTQLVKVVEGDRERSAREIGAPLGLSAGEVLQSPHFLAGTVEEMAADLLERRARWGISYLGLSGGNAPGGPDLRLVGRVIRELRLREEREPLLTMRNSG